MVAGIDSILLDKYPELIRDVKRIGERTIEDMPILFGSQGEIICIPNKREIPSPIGCIAKKGQGKSLILHRVCDEAFWNWGINVSIMNDSLEECYDWCFAQNNKKWIGQLMKIRELPLSLPIVYVYAQNKDLRLKEEKRYGKKGLFIKGKYINYVKISLPFSAFLDNLNQFMDLGGSEPYLINLKDELLSCQNEDEVWDVVSKIKVGKATDSVVNKIRTLFDNVFREQILRITNPDSPEYISAAGYYGNPFVSLMNLGVVPCFITSNLWTQKYKAQIYAHHINSIFQAQDDIFYNKKTYLIFDELTKVCSTNDKNVAGEALEQISARGRMKNIGIGYATQNYEKIPSIIRTNTEYLFALRHSSRKEVAEVKKDFDLPDYVEDDLLRLKKLECYGITSERFVVYYPDGTVDEDVTGPVKGTIIPPTSRHKMPR